MVDTRCLTRVLRRLLSRAAIISVGSNYWFVGHAMVYGVFGLALAYKTVVWYVGSCGMSFEAT